MVLKLYKFVIYGFKRNRKDLNWDHYFLHVCRQISQNIKCIHWSVKYTTLKIYTQLYIRDRGGILTSEDVNDIHLRHYKRRLNDGEQ